MRVAGSLRLPLSLRKNIGQRGFGVKVGLGEQVGLGELVLPGGIELLSDLLWGGEAPCRFEGTAQGGLPGGL